MNKSILFIYHIFVILSFVVGQLGRFINLAIVNSAMIYVSIAS
jgi:hypothetical protein